MKRKEKATEERSLKVRSNAVNALCRNVERAVGYVADTDKMRLPG